MKNIIIAVDVMGGDNAPEEIVKGCVKALEEFDVKLILIGDITIIKQELSKYNFDKNKLRILHAQEVIGNDEIPTTAIKTKKDSSIVVGLKMLKEGKVGAFVSAGSTGALLTGATVIVGRIKGVERPALATILPNEKGFSLLIDAGANLDAKPNYLLQFAKMGSVYMENVIGVKNPTVGLLNVGTEKEKGNLLVKESYHLLEQADLNFVGNIEARDIPFGISDVIVCDAFVGNVILKYSEGFAEGLFSMIKNELMNSKKSKLGAMLSQDGFRNLKKSFDPSEVGGAPFLGVNGLVVKAHGSSDANAIKNAIKQCSLFIENNIVKKIEDKI